MLKLVLEKAEEQEIIEKAREFQKNFIVHTKAFDCVDHNKLWKILKELGIPDHLTCLLRNLYAGQEATVRTGHETTDLVQIRKGVCQSYTLSPCLFHLYAEYITLILLVLSNSCDSEMIPTWSWCTTLFMYC